jgi:hypothetical protein
MKRHVVGVQDLIKNVRDLQYADRKFIILKTIGNIVSFWIIENVWVQKKWIHAEKKIANMLS